MATINDKFLDSFRALDTELKCDDKSIMDYENSLEGIDQERMKVCRIMRNYMSHNDITFLTPSNEQIKFLDTQLKNVLRQANIVKDEMKKIKLVKETEPIKNLIPIVDKNGIVPLETKSNGIYLVTKEILLHQLALGNKKIIIPTRLPKYQYITPLHRISKITHNVNYIVTEDGTISGKYLGILVI